MYTEKCELVTVNPIIQHPKPTIELEQVSRIGLFERQSRLIGKSLTHLKMATFVCELYKERIHWVVEWHSWVKLNADSIWEKVDECEIKRLIIECLEQLRAYQKSKYTQGGAVSLEELKEIERAGSAGFINGTESVLKNLENIAISCSVFDAAPLIAGMKEGDLYNLENNTYRRIEPTDYLTKHIFANFDNDSECPLWEKSINEWCNGDQQLVEFLQTFCGYSLSGLTTFQGFLFLTGDGKNGKSVFVKVISTLIGKYATGIQSETLMQQKKSSGAASGDIARLAGVRFATAQEIAEGSFFDENLLKQLTGGDLVIARHLYQSDFEFTPCLKLIISGNHRPIVKGTDNGFWRRMHLIPFNATITNPDSQLTEKLLGEINGILNWCLIGWKRYQSEGIKVPDIIKNESKAYRDDMDLLAQWKNECVIEKVGSKVTAITLYQSYKDWAAINGYQPLTRNSFGRNAKRLLGEPKRSNQGMHYENYQQMYSSHVYVGA